MQSKPLPTIEDVTEFVTSLATEDRHLINVRQQEDKTFLVEWTDHKKYINSEGVEVFDEVWQKANGDLMVIQDISHAHCQNILRMILRRQRELTESVEDLLGNGSDYFGEDEDLPEDVPRVLH